MDYHQGVVYLVCSGRRNTVFSKSFIEISRTCGLSSVHKWTDIKKPWKRIPLPGLDFLNVQTDQKNTILELVKVSLSPFFTNKKILSPGPGFLLDTLYST